MEKDSAEISRLSHPNSVQERKPRRRWRKRDQTVVENSQPNKPKIKTYPIPAEVVVPSSASRGEKRRNSEEEDDEQKVKRVMTQHTCTNKPDSDGIHHDKTSQDKSILTVNQGPGGDVTDDKRLLEKSTLHMNGSLLERCEKRKSEINQYSVNSIKRLRVSQTSEKSNVSDHHDSDDSIGYIPCKNSCVCKVGLSHKPTPIERRGYPQIVPLYKKLLQRRMLSTLNVVINDCCERQCCNIWSGRRYSNQRFEAGYDPSNLRVDHFKWGVWKQKPEIQKDNNNNNDNDDDDWFW